RLHDPLATADDRRRTAPPGRQLHRAGRAARGDRPPAARSPGRARGRDGERQVTPPRSESDRRRPGAPAFGCPHPGIRLPCRRDARGPIMPQPLTLYLAAPRGFCAGVDRAIKIVEMALVKWGAPVYVRHEIVHNRFVVDGLRAKGAVFVEELDELPGDRPVIFSAHGVPKAVPAEAARRNMIYVDATCPLVSKVHIEAERHHQNGLQMV